MGGKGPGFAINRLDVTSTPQATKKPASAVPAPGVLVLFGLGIFGMGALRWRRNGPAEI